MAIDRETLKQVFREQGFDDHGYSPHGWRCDYPDLYPDECTCLDDMATALIERLAL
jgi:hypothetical protein